MAALRGLPERQGGAIVLRYYAGLPESEIAATIGISTGAVQSRTARGLSALHAALEQADPQPAHPRDSDDTGRPPTPGRRLGVRYRRMLAGNTPPAAGLAGCGLGKMTLTKRPPSGMRWAVMAAWCAVAMARTMDRPSPCPS